MCYGAAAFFVANKDLKIAIYSLKDHALDQPVGVPVGVVKVVEGATDYLHAMVDGANVLMSSILHTAKCHPLYSTMK